MKGAIDAKVTSDTDFKQRRFHLINGPVMISLIALVIHVVSRVLHVHLDVSHVGAVAF
jgi:hypothetical protein